MGQAEKLNDWLIMSQQAQPRRLSGQGCGAGHDSPAAFGTLAKNFGAASHD